MILRVSRQKEVAAAAAILSLSCCVSFFPVLNIQDAKEMLIT